MPRNLGDRKDPAVILSRYSKEERRDVELIGRETTLAELGFEAWAQGGIDFLVPAKKKRTLSGAE